MSEFYTFLEHLLYEHECVIIPQFGGFVVNAQDFLFDEKEGKIHPKKKSVAFNEKLKTDDRFLSTEWAEKKSISLKEASIEIVALGKELKSLLSSQGEVSIGLLGSLTLNAENRISFLPNPDFNADLSVFGLLPVGLGYATPRLKERKPELIPAPIAENLPTHIEEDFKPIPLTSSIYVYAFIAFVLGGLGAFFLTAPTTNQAQSSLNPIKIEKKVLQVATPITVKKDTLPTLPAPVVVKTQEVDIIYLVAGSFQTFEQAEKGLKEFKSLGFEQAELILKNEKTKFYRISLGTEHSMEAGYKKASQLKEVKKVDIWVLKAL
jgi:hypothetical protein